jgi:hypothetical protein
MKSASLLSSITSMVSVTVAWTLLSTASAQNLLQNTSFENGTYSGSNTFVDNLNSLSLTFPTPGHNNAGNALNYWGSDAAQWIEDGTRATDGNRFLWLAGGGTYCAGQELSFGAGQSLEGGSTYRFTFDFAAVNFNGGVPGDSTSLGSTGLTGGRLELNWVNSAGGIISQVGTWETEQLTNGFAGGPLSLQNAVTWDSLQTAVGTVGSGWNRGFVDVTLPGAGPSGAVGVLVSLSNSNNQTNNTGLAVDNASVAAVPEPSGLVLLSAGLVPLVRRRRR